MIFLDSVFTFKDLINVLEKMCYKNFKLSYKNLVL